ncbi:MAG TPA: glycerol kinase, partial [Sphaerochaeta sp.]|nr:glycerol kinase [Sphaerochaeta sp.]
KKAHIVRAAEESIAYQIADVVYAMEAESGIPLQELRVDGGPTRDQFL